jgi:hypothetical protein
VERRTCGSNRVEVADEIFEQSSLDAALTPVLTASDDPVGV